MEMKRILLSLLALVAIGTGARAQDMTATPLTLEATTEGDITFSVSYQYVHPVVLTPIEYKINDGSWTTYSWPTDEAAIKSGGDWPHTFGNAIHVLVGDKVAFRGNNAFYYGNGKGFESHIASTADVYVYGNFMSLIHATDFATNYAMTGDWNFAKLFRKEGAQPWDPPMTVTTIKSHPTNDIVLPATSLTNNCYTGLFAGCKGITRAPELPSTTMTVGCYQEMFRGTGLTAVPALPTTVFQEYSFEGGVEHGSIDCYMQMFQDCTSLVTVPSNLLPATKLVHGVYQNMFEGCTSLTSLPTLPATDLTGGDQCYTSMFKDCTSLTSVPADYLPAAKLDLMCYAWMFAGCTSLTSAPALPATTVANDCYHRMFEGCTLLTTAPDLPASTLIGQCYGGMFDGCTSLNYVKCLATTFDDKQMNLGDWMKDVAATGTFVKAEIADYPLGISGIPTGWTIQTQSGVGVTETLTANDDGAGNYWTTYYNSLASVTADANTTVYKAKVSGDKVVLTDVGNKDIPAGNAVVLKSTASSVTMSVGSASGTFSNNDLIGQSAPFTTQVAYPSDNVYALVNGASGVGFYNYPKTYMFGSTSVGTNFPAQKAYLVIAGGGGVKAFYPLSGDEGTTAIEMAETADEARDAALYDLSGRRLQGNPRSGIYVKNGKKIIIK